MSTSTYKPTYGGEPLTHCDNCGRKLESYQVSKYHELDEKHGVPQDERWALCRACEYERDALHAYLDSVSNDYEPI